MQSRVGHVSAGAAHVEASAAFCNMFEAHSEAWHQGSLRFVGDKYSFSGQSLRALWHPSSYCMYVLSTLRLSS